MKSKKIMQITCLLSLLMTTTSCKKAIENMVSKEIAINNRTVIFDVASATKSAEAFATRVSETITPDFTINLFINLFNPKN